MKHLMIIMCAGAICLGILVGSISYGADIPAIREAKDSAERVRVQALIDGARKENILDWRGTYFEPKHSEYLIAGFKEYYGLTELKCNYGYGNSTEIIGRVTQVIQAGRTPPDIVWLIAWDWFTDLMKEGKLMRYDSPYYAEYAISNKAGNSMPGYWVSDSYSNIPVWNVTELEKRGIKNFNPNSWWDFADPKIAPLTCFSNIVLSNADASWAIGMRKTVGDEWFIKIGKGKPGLYARSQQGEVWVGSGEYPICLSLRIKNAQTLVEGGAFRVGWLWPKEGQVLFPFAPVIFSNAPHPNTAKLFIDYVRSSAGTNRAAESGVGLIYGRPGVKVPEKEKQFLPPNEEIKVISMDWNKEVTPKTMRAVREWAKGIGFGY